MGLDTLVSILSPLVFNAGQAQNALDVQNTGGVDLRPHACQKRLCCLFRQSHRLRCPAPRYADSRRTTSASGYERNRG